MIIIMDFDDVLFDRRGKFTKASKKAGVDLARGEPLYESCKTDGNYDFRQHIKLIAKGDRQKEKKLLDNMESVFKNTPNFLFDGVIDLLENLKQKQYRLVLATRGKVYLQKKKIENSGLEKFFNEIIFSEKYKAEFLADKIRAWHRQGEKIVLLDDSSKEIELMKERFPYVRSILVKPGHLFHSLIAFS
jgi:FMN phosphatase YigB (HAD superfamily)